MVPEFAPEKILAIIRSKEAANRPKDQRVLPTLRELLASRYQQEQESES